MSMDSMDGADLVCLDKGTGEVVPVILKQYLKRLVVRGEEGDQLKWGCCLSQGCRFRLGGLCPRCSSVCGTVRVCSLRWDLAQRKSAPG